MKKTFFVGSILLCSSILSLGVSDITMARTFLSTHSKTVSVFADQLPVQNMNDAQIRFVAEHYVGTQKLYKNQIEKIRAYNPDFLMLHYRLAAAAGEVPAIAHDSDTDGSVNPNIFSSEEWDTNLKNKDWFLKTAQDHPLQNTTWNWYAFDLARSSQLRDEIADYWSNRVKKEVTATESDGVFADSFGIPFGPWSLNMPPAYAYNNSFEIDIPAAQSWLSNTLVPYSDRIWSSLRASHIAYIPNCGQLITSWDSIENYTHSDGCMIEGFTGFGSSIKSVSDWKLELNNILALSKKGKVTIAQTTFPILQDVKRRGFIVGSYLLSKGEKSYVNMLADQGNGFEWYPEYDVDLGPYISVPNTIDDLAWNGVYRRDFEHGFVLVNPSSEKKVISFDRKYSLATFTNGGIVQTDAAPPGSVSYKQEVGAVTLEPQSAAFLVDNIINSPHVTISECPLPVDQAYRTIASPAVYYVDLDCKKRPFRNAQIFFTYFDSWNDVKITGPSFLSRIPDHELGFMPLGPKYDPKYGALVKTVTDSRVYFLLNEKKYWITSEYVFNKLNYQWNWIEDVDDRLLKKYVSGGEITGTLYHLDGTIVKYADSNRVYVIENGKKRYITSEAEFNSRGYRWDRIVTIPESEMYDDVDAPVMTPIRLYAK